MPIKMSKITFATHASNEHNKYRGPNCQRMSKSETEQMLETGKLLIGQSNKQPPFIDGEDDLALFFKKFQNVAEANRWTRA